VAIIVRQLPDPELTGIRQMNATPTLEEECIRQDWLDSLDEELEQELDDGGLDALVGLHGLPAHSTVPTASR
jgi:hypothetical protein